MRTFQVLLFLVLAGLVGSNPAAGTADLPVPPGSRQEIDSILARQEISLPDLFRLAELTNPELAAGRMGVVAQSGRVEQAGLYPNPEISLAFEELYLDDPSVHKLELELMQPLLIGGRRGAAVAAARANLNAAGYRLQQARRETLRRVHQLWGQQLYIREAETVFTELMRVAESTLEIARTRFEARAAPESQVTKAMLEVYELEVARQQLDQDRVRLSTEFAAFFGQEPVPLDRLVGSLDPDPEEEIAPADLDAIAAEYPALRAARMSVVGAEASLREARAERTPDLGLFLTYGNEQPMGEGYIGGGISLPVPLFHRNQGRVTETRALVAQAEYRVRIVRNDLEVALAGARQRHRMLHEQLDAVTGRIVPVAERGLDQAQEAYRVGRLMFLELVDAQRTLRDVRLRTLALRRDLVMAEAELQSLLGSGPYAHSGDM